MLKLRVKCPYCGAEKTTKSTKRVKCDVCFHSFEIFPLDSRGNFKKTRVVGVVEGSLSELHRLAYAKKLGNRRR